MDTGFDRSKINSLRQAWIDAVKDSDVSRLTSLVSDDFVWVHGDGRCISGKAEIGTDFSHAFERFDAEPSVLSSEVSLRGKRAIELLEVETVRTAIGNDPSVRERFTYVVVFCQQSSATWKVSRIIALPD
jgi:ketosteroid isomerase-like protein